MFRQGFPTPGLTVDDANGAIRFDAVCTEPCQGIEDCAAAGDYIFDQGHVLVLERGPSAYLQVPYDLGSLRMNADGIPEI